MNDFAVRLLGATLGLSVSCLAVQGLTLVLRPSSARVQQTAWLLVLVQGVVLVHLPIRLPWYRPPATQIALREEQPTVEIRTRTLAADGAPSYVARTSLDETPALASPSVGDATEAVSPAERLARLLWPSIAGIVWLGGMAVLAFCSGLTYLAFLRRLSQGRPARQEWIEEWLSVLRDYGITRAITLVVTQGDGPALCWTHRGYRVCLPGRSWAKLAPSQRLLVLRHEAAHFVRRDLWTQVLARILALPHWLNPCAWWAVRQAAECVEWACDQRAAGTSRRNGLAYAKALLELGVAKSSGLCSATARQGSSLFVRIRRIARNSSRGDSFVKKTLILGLAAALVVLNLIRIELLAAESSGTGPETAAESPTADSRTRTSPATADSFVGLHSSQTRTYYVGDLVQSENALETLCQEIRSKVVPDSWQPAGGDGSIAPFGPDLSICVSHNAKAQDQIASFLAEKRRGMPRFRIHTAFFRGTPEKLDEAGVKWRVLSAHFSVDTASTKELSSSLPLERSAGVSGGSAPNWSRLVIEKIQPVMLDFLDEDRGAMLQEHWRKDTAVSLVAGPTTTVFNGESVDIRDVSQTEFVVGLQDGRPQTRLVPDGTVLELRPLLVRDGKLRLHLQATFSHIRGVDALDVNGQGTIQIPEVETTRVQSAIDLSPRSWLLLRGPRHKVEGVAPRWPNHWLSFLAPWQKTVSVSREELLVMISVQKAASLEISVDTSEAPDMAAWAAHAKDLCVKSYPMILKQLAAPGFEPPEKVRIVFKRDEGIAFTSGTTITCMEGWFKAHPDDYGAVIHELCHVVQAYGASRVPGWVTEGIADYVRWFHFEPKARRPRVNPQRAKYTDSYQTTAAFFDWIVRTKDPSFVRRLNEAARNGKYSPDLFRSFVGKPVDGLWGEFIESLQTK